MFVPCALLVLLAAIPATVLGDGDVANPDGFEEVRASGPDAGQLPRARSGPFMREHAERILKKKCLKNADIETFNRTMAQLELAVVEYVSCVSSTENNTELRVEGRPGEDDLVTYFRNVCRKTPIMNACLRNLTPVVDACLDETEREQLRIWQNFTEDLKHYACDKDGDRIAQFFAEGGKQCFMENKEEIKRCSDVMVSKYFADKLPSSNRGREELCQEARQLKTCIVSKMQTCSQPTPANTFEAMFNYAYTVSPCGNLTTAPRGLESTTGNTTDLFPLRDFELKTKRNNSRIVAGDQAALYLVVYGFILLQTRSWEQFLFVLPRRSRLPEPHLLVKV